METVKHRSDKDKNTNKRNMCKKCDTIDLEFIVTRKLEICSVYLFIYLF